MERLLRPEDFEVSLRYVLKHAIGRGSNIFKLFDTSEKPNHFAASRRRLESQGRDGARQENGQNEWYILEYQASASEEEDHWVVMEDRRKRRRRNAFENLAKRMLRYLDGSNDVVVDITALQERVEVLLQFGTSIQQVAQQAMNESGQKMFEIFWRSRRIMFCQLDQMGGAAERLSRLGKVSRHKSGNSDAEQKRRNIPECDRR